MVFLQFVFSFISFYLIVEEGYFEEESFIAINTTTTAIKLYQKFNQQKQATTTSRICTKSN
eukprot:m.164482 g.164482  ORF g.164482 m.164482 type:complete len:61 (-) comp13424_c0_seq4:5622-5804(-)